MMTHYNDLVAVRSYGNRAKLYHSDGSINIVKSEPKIEALFDYLSLNEDKFSCFHEFSTILHVRNSQILSFESSRTDRGDFTIRIVTAVHVFLVAGQTEWATEDLAKELEQAGIEPAFPERIAFRRPTAAP